MNKSPRLHEANNDRDRKSFLHQSREFYRENNWWIIPVLFLASMALGYFGFVQYKLDHKLDWSKLDCLYGTIQLIILDSGGFSANIVDPNTKLGWARFLVPIFGILTILETLARIAGVQFDFLLIRLFFRHHVVICGLGENGKRLAEKYCDEKKRVIVIESDKNNENLSSIITYRSSLFRLSIKAIVGNAADKFLLKKLKVHQAETIYAFTDRDDFNLKIALQVREVLEEISGTTKPPLKCHIHIFEKELYDCLHRKDPFDNSEFDAEVFNIHEQAARIMFRKHSPDRYFLEGPKRKEPVNILLVGGGSLGEKLLHQIVRVGHFANLQPTRVTVIDRNAEVLTALKQRLGNIASTNYLEIFCSARDVMQLGPADLPLPQYDLAYVCVGDDNLGFVCASHLRDQSYLAKESVIAVAMPQKNELARVLGRSRESSKIFFFKIIDEVIPELHNPVLDDIAKKVHRVWDPAIDSDEQVVKYWRSNPDYRESSRSNADHLEIKLRAIQCRLDASGDSSLEHELKPEEIDLLAEMEHRRYYAERLLLGWAWGPEKDASDKKGPYIQAYEYLTDEQKEKNKVDFVSLINKLDVRIVKIQQESESGANNS